ncbi:hypothetical protein MKW94_014664 [Papaver nudicaule]|uniref:Phytocyanin domain-containing protein n=1 Tax=Papaver nudicaule TaxID=74823 RepID=A0AA41VNN6_PAPNU|nr:hypothetical protein [Papaver nudicaule]
MGFNTNFLLSCLLIMLTVPSMVNSFTFNVGDAAGWSVESGVNYTNWAMRPFFFIADRLHFVYDPKITNVLEVTSPDYESCNPSSPLATYNTGNDMIPLTKVGHQYFISGNQVDCNKRLKFGVEVYNDTNWRISRACPECDNPYLAPKTPCCKCPGCDDPLIPRLQCCDKNTSTTPTTSPTSTTSASTPIALPTSTGTTVSTPTTSPTSTPSGGAAALTPTMSPNSTSAGGEATTRATPPKSTTSAALKFSLNSLLVVGVLFLH